MKKSVMLVFITILTLILNACVGIGYQNLIKDKTIWESEDNRLTFTFQNNNGLGFGKMIINETETPVIVEMTVAGHPRVEIFTYNLETDKFERIIVFDMESYWTFKNKVTDRVKLIIDDNQTNDQSYNENFDIKRRDLSNLEINAKYYLMNSWINEEYQIHISQVKKSVFEFILEGTVKSENITYDVTFQFLEDNYFVFKDSNDEIIMYGEYQTNGEELILNLVENLIYVNVSKISLTVKYDISNWLFE